MFEVKPSRLGVNDDFVIISKWKVKKEDIVKRGQIIAELETSKAVYEIEAEKDGIIKILVEEDEEVSFDTVIAVIYEGDV